MEIAIELGIIESAGARGRRPLCTTKSREILTMSVSG